MKIARLLFLLALLTANSTTFAPVVFAGLFEFPIEICLQNERSTEITMTLIYDSGRTRQWSLAAGASILMTKQRARDVLKTVVVAVNGKMVQRCEIPVVRVRSACLHIGQSNCWISDDATAQKRHQQ